MKYYALFAANVAFLTLNIGMAVHDRPSGWTVIGVIFALIGLRFTFPVVRCLLRGEH